jgi:predicted esterase
MINRRSRVNAILFLALFEATSSASADGPFEGEWRTSFGTATLKQNGNEVTGTYGGAGQFTLKGTVDGQKLTFEYQEGQARGDGGWTLDKLGHAFTGRFAIRGGRAGDWLGWRPDPAAAKGPPANLSGLWLTNLGLMELEQAGEKVKGRYAVRGTSEIEGTVSGRRVEFKFKSVRPGKGWFDAAPSGDTLAGAANNDGLAGWYGWRGRKAPEFVRRAELVPGKIVDGSTAGLLTYSVRAPEGFKAGEAKKWPAIVILHGSNMNAKAYVNTLAVAWPEIANDYLLIGINGEQPSNTGDEPAFNYTYVSYVGRSTFRGFPGTDRESPALVAEALDDLRKAYPISQFFVGGHSQGGFLTYSLLMNFPEKIAGAFPISAGVIFQCEPTAYADEAVRAAQRRVPLSIVHGKQDPLVGFASGEYAATIFAEAGWPAFRFFADDTGAGHMFARLPVGKAIRWLEAQSSDDAAWLVDFAERQWKANRTRDAVTALDRASTLFSNNVDKLRIDNLAHEIDAKAAAGAAEFLPKITSGQEGKTWIDAFLAYRDDFEFAPAAREVMQAFGKLRAEHEGPAKKTFDEATAAFRQNKRDEGYAKYQEIADKYYAAPSYRNVKRWLDEGK